MSASDLKITNELELQKEIQRLRAKLDETNKNFNELNAEFSAAANENRQFEENLKIQQKNHSDRQVIINEQEKQLKTIRLKYHELQQKLKKERDDRLEQKQTSTQIIENLNTEKKELMSHNTQEIAKSKAAVTEKVLELKEKTDELTMLRTEKNLKIQLLSEKTEADALRIKTLEQAIEGLKETEKKQTKSMNQILATKEQALAESLLKLQEAASEQQKLKTKYEKLLFDNEQTAAKVKKLEGSLIAANQEKKASAEKIQQLTSAQEQREIQYTNLMLETKKISDENESNKEALNNAILEKNALSAEYTDKMRAMTLEQSRLNMEIIKVRGEKLIEATNASNHSLAREQSIVKEENTMDKLRDTQEELELANLRIRELEAQLSANGPANSNTSAPDSIVPSQKDLKLDSESIKNGNANLNSNANSNNMSSVAPKSAAESLPLPSFELYQNSVRLVDPNPNMQKPQPL